MSEYGDINVFFERYTLLLITFNSKHLSLSSHIAFRAFYSTACRCTCVIDGTLQHEGGYLF
jgi:hypothetical protein